jgi:hypothetical protein
VPSRELANQTFRRTNRRVSSEETHAPQQTRRNSSAESNTALIVCSAFRRDRSKKNSKRCSSKANEETQQTAQEARTS